MEENPEKAWTTIKILKQLVLEKDLKMATKKSWQAKQIWLYSMCLFFKNPEFYIRALYQPENLFDFFGKYIVHTWFCFIRIRFFRFHRKNASKTIQKWNANCDSSNRKRMAAGHIRNFICSFCVIGFEYIHVFDGKHCIRYAP